MRFVSKCPEFEWRNKRVCYLFIGLSGEVFQIEKDISAQEAYSKVSANKGRLVAVWPGNWRSDAFIIDDIRTFGLTFDCIHEDLPLKIIGYSHKTIEFDTTFSKHVDFVIECSREVHSLPNFLKRFSDKLEQEFGWTIALSRGYSMIDNNIISVYVKQGNGEKISDSWGNIGALVNRRR